MQQAYNKNNHEAQHGKPNGLQFIGLKRDEPPLSLRRAISEDTYASSNSKNHYVSVWDFLNSDDDHEECTALSTRSGTEEINGFFSIEDCTQVPAEYFEEPCHPVETSGGTAAFFHVRYRTGQIPPGRLPDHFVGKDLAHASDEIEFYEKLRTATGSDNRWSNFAEIAMDCPGVCQIICRDPKDSLVQLRSLLLLENLRNGFNKMRLCDVKLGAETSVACWKGKSRLHAWKNARVDQRTNSLAEGFRLEGMELPPRAIEEWLEAVNANKGSMRRNFISDKAAKRFFLQRLRAHEFLAAWLDVSALGAGSELHTHGAVWASVEQVGQLLQRIIDLPVPQQWIGSSLAVGMESGTISKKPKVTIKVFDWGRAELNSKADHEALTQDQRKERVRYWRQYVRAVCRFYWELCRVAAHRCCCRAWCAFVFELRVQPLSVVRAALMGGERSTVLGVGLYPMPPKGLKGGSASVVLPLVAVAGGAQPVRSAASGGGQKALVGTLHTRLSTPEGLPGGEGSVIIEVRGATQLPNDLDTSGASVTLVRVIGFERSGDARLHCEAWRSGLPEPVPRGRVYSQTTAPGKLSAATMVWEANLEFYGLGDAAEALQLRLLSALPATEGDGATSTESLQETFPGSSWPKPRQSVVGNSHGNSPWPELLPPTIGDQVQFEHISQLFGSYMVPWHDEGSPCPKDWGVH